MAQNQGGVVSDRTAICAAYAQKTFSKNCQNDEATFKQPARNGLKKPAVAQNALRGSIPTFCGIMTPRDYSPTSRPSAYLHQQPRPGGRGVDGSSETGTSLRPEADGQCLHSS